MLCGGCTRRRAMIAENQPIREARHGSARRVEQVKQSIVVSRFAPRPADEERRNCKVNEPEAMQNRNLSCFAALQATVRRTWATLCPFAEDVGVPIINDQLDIAEFRSDRHSDLLSVSIYHVASCSCISLSSRSSSSRSSLPGRKVCSISSSPTYS